MSEDHRRVPATTANVANKGISISASTSPQDGSNIAIAVVTALKRSNFPFIHNLAPRPKITYIFDRFVSSKAGPSITLKSKDGV
jgi:hypothetical protein